MTSELSQKSTFAFKRLCGILKKSAFLYCIFFNHPSTYTHTNIDDSCQSLVTSLFQHRHLPLYLRYIFFPCTSGCVHAVMVIAGLEMNEKNKERTLVIFRSRATHHIIIRVACACEPEFVISFCTTQSLICLALTKTFFYFRA